MKAAVYRTYGPPEVVGIEDVERPIPAHDEVLVRVVASTLCTADWRLRKPDPPLVGWVMNGFPHPTKIQILGMEFAGTVDSMGRNVTVSKTGDRVFGATWKFGAHADYVAVPERSIARMPESVTFKEAAALPYGGTSALYFLKQAGILAGQRVLIYGASGSVGTAAVQLAKYFGADVTGVCSTANLQLVSSLGADEVIDYTKNDFSKCSRIYDVVHDTVGKSGLRRGMRALRRGGVYILPGPVWAGPEAAVGAVWAKTTGACRIIGGVARAGVTALHFIAELVETGKFKPVIDRCFALTEIAEAHRYAETGHKKGNVVIAVAE